MKSILTSQFNKASRIRDVMTTFAYYSAFAALGLTSAATGPALPWLALQTQSHIDEIGLIFVSSSLGYMMGSLVSGKCYSRFSGHRIQAAMLMLTAAASAVVPLVQWLWLLAVMFFLVGAGQGGIDVGCNILLAWLHGEKVGPFMNALHFFFGVGSLVAPIIVIQIFEATGSMRWVYWSFAIIMFFVAAWLLTLPSPTVRRENSFSSEAAAPALLVGLFVFFFAMYVGAEMSYGNWLFTYARKLGLASEAEAAILTSAFWGFFTAGRILGIIVSTRLSSKIMLSMDLIGCLLSLGAILLWSSSLAILWICTMTLGLSMASVFPTMLVFAQEHIGLSGEVTSWFLIGSGVGGMFLPSLIGELFEPLGPYSAPIIVFTALLISLAVVPVIAIHSGRLKK